MKRTVGFVNGCFDIMHVGHIKMLEYCKKYCDYLIVGIDSDSMVKRAKGDHRPINNQNDRKFFLENLKHVDKVFIFNSHKVLKEKLNKIKPDIMVVGEEYRDNVVGGYHAKEIKYFKRIDGYSTTKIENLIDR